MSSLSKALAICAEQCSHACLARVCQQVFARGGNAILPVNSSGRMLEVLLVLDQLWHTHK